MGLSDLIAILASWVITEVSRQPWVVCDLQRAADTVSAHGDLHMNTSLLFSFVVYNSVFGVDYSYMIRLIRKGSQENDPIILPTDMPTRLLLTAVLDSQPEAYH